jgi:hypothetical protein
MLAACIAEAGSSRSGASLVSGFMPITVGVAHEAPLGCMRSSPDSGVVEQYSWLVLGYGHMSIRLNILVTTISPLIKLN